ncbi:MAG: hypothetical protein WCQ67_02425 [Treponema sp.]
MINTLNETSLHKTLKTIYSLENEGSLTEQTIKKPLKKTKNSCIKYANTSNYIFDIVTKKGNVIEIQTGNLGHLLAKSMYLIQEKRKIKVVYPLAATKYIQTENIDEGTVKKRKSPASKTIYSVFRELTSLCPVLLDKYFTLEVIEVTLTEERKTGSGLVQSKNNRRRFRKNWNKTGKHLDSIDGKVVLHGKKSYISLLPKSIVDLNESFTVSDLHNAFVEQKIKIKRNEVSLIAWVYSHMGLFEFEGKKGRAYLYKINK